MIIGCILKKAESGLPSKEQKECWKEKLLQLKMNLGISKLKKRITLFLALQ